MKHRAIAHWDWPLLREAEVRQQVAQPHALLRREPNLGCRAQTRELTIDSGRLQRKVIDIVQVESHEVESHSSKEKSGCLEFWVLRHGSNFCD